MPRLPFLRPCLLLLLAASVRAAAPAPLHVFDLKQRADAAGYDEAMAVATLQGVINRDTPDLYVLTTKPGGMQDPSRPKYWLEVLSRPGQWLAGRPQVTEPDLDALVRLAGPRLKGAVIWDPAVPATVNVATTVAGVRDGIVLSPALAEKYLARWKLPVLEDLRGRFTGRESGSAKIDAYRWAIREFLAKGRCSTQLLCLYHDAWRERDLGMLDYVVNRDLAVRNRSFVFDLSPWSDETPADDPGQRLGLDLETYKEVLAETRRHADPERLTEMAGFFSFEKYSTNGGRKSRHEPVPTEWESVWTISPYLVFQNTVTSDTCNQSVHAQAPRVPLRQNRTAHPKPVENKSYLCIFMADYDSSFVLYDFLPKHWSDPNRGKLPLAWGINPNLLDTFPDLIAGFYATMTPADTIVADAGAAGYINPSRIPEDKLPVFTRHNARYFREADMTIAPMVLDWVAPSPAVKDAFTRFSPDGMGSMVWDMHSNSGPHGAAEVWKGMPVLELINAANEFPNPELAADQVAQGIIERGNAVPGFWFFRIVWTSPTQILEMLEILHRKHPELNTEVLDVHTFFAMARAHLEAHPAAPAAPR